VANNGIIIVLIPLQKEVVPVDTHVYQIATKHYGMKSPTSGKKVNMTQKLYEEVNSKFLSIWGDYAGWAHTVRRSCSQCHVFDKILSTFFPDSIHSRPQIILYIWTSLTLTLSFNYTPHFSKEEREETR
jgi:N-glycosylase/DNA lyase